MVRVNYAIRKLVTLHYILFNIFQNNNEVLYSNFTRGSNFTRSYDPVQWPYRNTWAMNYSRNYLYLWAHFAYFVRHVKWFNEENCYKYICRSCTIQFHFQRYNKSRLTRKELISRKKVVFFSDTLYWYEIATRALCVMLGAVLKLITVICNENEAG